jgi:hypothetical protein
MARPCGAYVYTTCDKQLPADSGCDLTGQVGTLQSQTSINAKAELGFQDP